MPIFLSKHFTILSRRNIVYLTFLLGFLFVNGQQWNREAIMRALDVHAIEPIEGIWQFPEDGATIGIVRNTSTTFTIVLLDSPHLDIPPDCEIGHATITPIQGRYDAVLKASKLANSKIKKANSVIDVIDGRLRFKTYSDQIGISLKKWLPYFFRKGIVDPNTPEGLQGAVRIYPLGIDNYMPCL